MLKTVETIGRYELSEELGRGSMGVVHRAHDPVMGRDVAIKTILMPHGLGAERTDEYQERFLREARAAGRLSHPGIVTIYDFDRHDDGLPFIAMEFVEGPTLHELICHEGALKPSWAIDVATTLADALETAHEVGIVHRDLKPANVLVRAADGAAKITDFGVARMSRSDLTQTGTTYGSPAYIAPECLRGQRADGRSDLFALGVMLYEMLSGGRPFDGDDFAAVCHAICNEPPRPVGAVAGDLTPAFNTFFARALAKDPERRFQTGAQFVAALTDLRDQQERYAAEGPALHPVCDAAEPPRLDPDRPDAAERRYAAMGRTGELIISGARDDAGSTSVLAFPVPGDTDRVGTTRAITEAIDSAIPDGERRPDDDVAASTAPIDEVDDGSAMALIQQWFDVVAAFVRRQPALAGGVALGIALLLLVALVGRGETPALATAEPSNTDTVATAADRTGQPAMIVTGDETGAEPIAAPWEGLDEVPFGLPALSTPLDNLSVADADGGIDAAATPAATTAEDAGTRRTTPARSTRASRAPASTRSSAAVTVPESTSGDAPPDTAAADVAAIDPRPGIEPDSIVKAPPGIDPSSGPPPTAVTPAAGTVPLTIELRSGLKDGSLIVELDGTPIYSAELAAESRGFRRAMKKAVRRDETAVDDTIHVPAGEHSIVVRLVNNAKGTEHSATLETTLEPDGPHRLRIAAGRLLGKRLSVALVD